jgi:hypothetical protein
MKSILLWAVLLFQSCAYIEVLTMSDTDPTTLKGSFEYNYKDQTGNFTIQRKFGQNKSGEYILKKELRSPFSPRFLERFISISTAKKFNEKTSYLSPKVSESIFWLDKKRHKSFLKVNNKTLEITSSIQSKIYKKSSEVIEPNRVHCFYSQLVECIATTNFFELSARKKLGAMNFNIIWDGYPFFNEQYLNQSNNAVQRARMVYVEDSKGMIKYQLEVDDQILFYFLDNKFRLKNFYWVAKGISQEREGF